jgi:membrane fusion protein (multidrug efflux system)
MDRLMKKRMVWMLAGVALLAAGLVGYQVFKSTMIRKFMSAGANLPQTVTTTVVTWSEWVPEIQAVGSLRAQRGVDISPEVSGMVRQLRFHSGETIKAGQVLLEMNDDAEQAQLNTLKAALELARITVERDRPQLASQAISQAQMDADMADLASKEAQVAQQAALVAKKTLVAPFDGRLGISTVNPGQYLNPGDKVVTLQQISPILADFTVPQQQTSVLALGRKVSLTTDAWPGKVFAGEVTAINPAVDTATRNLSVEARISNPHEELLPGMFCVVKLSHGSKQSMLTLPQTAVTFNPYGATVFVVKQDAGKPVAQQVFVTTGPTRGDQVAIVSGLEAGATVVTSGQLKLKSGTPVAITNQLQPSNDVAPTPQEQ